MTTDLYLKVRYIYVPFILTLLAFISVYTLLMWLLTIRTQIISLPEITTDLFIPMGLSFVLSYLIIRPRVKLLALETARGDGFFLYWFIACFAIFIPAAIAQNYLRTATGKLTALNTINDINKQPGSKYYTVSKYYVANDHEGTYQSAHAAGKYNQSLVFELFVASPFLAAASDTSNEYYNTWYGVTYSKTISNIGSEESKNSDYQRFYEESIRSFYSYNFSSFTYLNRLGITDHEKGLMQAVKKTHRYNPAEPIIIFEPEFGSFESRNGDKLPWVFGSMGIFSGIWFLMLLFPALKKEKLSQLKKGRITIDDSWKETIKYLVPGKFLFTTTLIVDMNVLVYIIMIFSGVDVMYPGANELIAWGANNGPLTLNGEGWRLLTCIFLHAGLMHLVLNMFGLILAGIFLEKKIGRLTFAVTYLITGIAASITSVMWNYDGIGIGASGAIFGMYGIFLALLRSKVFDQKFTKVTTAFVLLYCGINLVMGFAISNVDNAAHIGGFLSGLLIGFGMAPSLKRKDRPENQYADSFQRKVSK